MVNNEKNTASRRAHRIRGMRILLVDDNATYLQATKFVIEHDGGIVGIARTGEEAITLLRQQPYDCVLMDVSMPGMSGIETTTRIRADRDIAPVRVIGVTGHSDARAREKCLSAGMDDVIVKPFELDALYALLAPPPK